MPKKIHFFLFEMILITVLAGCGTADQASVLPEASQTPKITLVVEEHPVSSQAEDEPTHFEFRQRINQETMDLRAAWRMPTAEQKVESLNESLTPFGYELRPHPEDPEYAYQLLSGDKVVVDYVSHFWPVSVNQDGDDFVLPVETIMESAFWFGVVGLTG